MTSRGRVRAALNHVQPDRVPVDFGSTMVTGISASVVSQVRKSLGLDGSDARIKVIEPYQMLGEIENDLRNTMHIDCIGLFGTKNMFGFENNDWKPWTMFDGTRVLVPGCFNTESDENGDIPMYACGDNAYPPCARMPKGGFYFDSTVRQKPIDEDRLRVEDNLEEFGPLSEKELEHLRVNSEWLSSNTEYAVVYSMPGTSFGDIAFVPGPGLKDPHGIRAVEEWYVSTAIRRDYVYEVFERECEIGLANLASVREAVGERIEVIFITGADFGTQRGPFISPDVYHELFMPFHKRLCDWIHRNTSWKTFMHSCGGIRPLLDDVIDAGFDIINPVQCSAEGMDARTLKDDFGSRLTFWGGGVDTQKTLPFGRPEDVYHEVGERIRILKRDGGFIFNSIHNIQAGTPVENVLAMLKALEDSF
jgi:hypothetical protein